MGQGTNTRTPSPTLLFRRHTSRRPSRAPSFTSRAHLVSSATVRSGSRGGPPVATARYTLLRCAIKLKVALQQAMVQQAMVQQAMVQQTMVQQTMVQQAMVQQTMVQQAMVQQVMLQQAMLRNALMPRATLTRRHPKQLLPIPERE